MQAIIVKLLIGLVVLVVWLVLDLVIAIPICRLIARNNDLYPDPLVTQKRTCARDPGTKLVTERPGDQADLPACLSPKEGDL